MPRSVQTPDPITSFRTRLRAADQAAGEVVIAVERLRATLRQAFAAVDEMPQERRPPSNPMPAPRPTGLPVTRDAPRFLRPKDVARMCGLSRTTIWRMQREEKFPERRRITARSVGWLAEDVEEWIRTR